MEIREIPLPEEEEEEEEEKEDDDDDALPRKSGWSLYVPQTLRSLRRLGGFFFGP